VCLSTRARFVCQRSRRARAVGDDSSAAEVAASIALLDETRAVEIAGDMLRLYEVLANLRIDDDYEL
jgi:hypothetical protein